MNTDYLFIQLLGAILLSAWIVLSILKPRLEAAFDRRFRIALADYAEFLRLKRHNDLAKRRTDGWLTTWRTEGMWSTRAQAMENYDYESHKLDAMILEYRRQFTKEDLGSAIARHDEIAAEHLENLNRLREDES